MAAGNRTRVGLRNLKKTATEIIKMSKEIDVKRRAGKAERKALREKKKAQIKW
jgi:hypothetical protein